jgi:hypothetical protein
MTADPHREAAPTPPGLQPQRTALAWTRTALGCGGLAAVMVRHALLTGRILDVAAAALVLLAALGVFILGRRRRGQIARDLAAGRNPLLRSGIPVVSGLVVLSALAVIGILVA